jgi:Family of unknown function (DUF5677)
MNDRFYDQFDEIVSDVIKILDDSDSQIKGFLSEYLLMSFESFFYGNIIHNFFLNLNAENLRECGLSSDYATKIKRRFKKARKDVKAALLETSGAPFIDEAFLDHFKGEIKQDFPNALGLLSRIEGGNGAIQAREYLAGKAQEIRRAGHSGLGLSSTLSRGALLAYVEKEGHLPRIEDLDKPINDLLDALPAISKDEENRLRADATEMLEQNRESQKGFEERLYERWREPLDSLECLIGLSMVYGQNHRDKLAGVVNETNSAKFVALLKIHQRALQIANEILALLKAGYADGAIARWRTLFELAAISFFLKDNDNEVSQRYLDHAAIRRYADAKDYQRYYEELGHIPFEKEECEKIKQARQEALKKYADGFGKGNWDWIPTSIAKPWFKALAQHVGLGHWIPYYNFASAALHGLSRGFYRLGLLAESQDTPLCGASNVGLADPLQNTAISLHQVTVILLTLQPDFESLMQPYVMDGFVKEIGEKAVTIQKALEEESSKSTSFSFS